MSPESFTTTAAELFSASEQTHCALVMDTTLNACSFAQRVLNINRSGYSAVFVVTWLRGAT